MLLHELGKFLRDALHTNLYSHLSLACFLRPVYIFYNVAMDTIDVKYLNIKVFLLNYIIAIFVHSMDQYLSNRDYYIAGSPYTSSYPKLNHALDHLHHPIFLYSGKKLNGSDRCHDHTIAYYRSQYWQEEIYLYFHLVF